MQLIQNILSFNQILTVSLLGWLVAQVLKTIINFILLGKFQLERMWGDGGMPSAHSGAVCGMTTAAARQYGGGSFEFAVCLILSMVVMYDARGVRRETGKQAKLLNSILLENPLKLSGEVLQEKLKEYVGHTPLQVAAGAILGIALAVFMAQYY